MHDEYNPESSVTQEDMYQERLYTPLMDEEQPYPTFGTSYKRFKADLAEETNDVDAFLAAPVCSHLDQGTVFADVKLHLVEWQGNDVSVHQINYCRVIVLSQSCDVLWNRESRKQNGNHDKILFSVLCAPIFDLSQAQTGEHLKGLSMNMERLNSKKREFIDKHDVARYYQLNSTDTECPDRMGFDKGIIDFKHFMTVPVQELHSSQFLTRLKKFRREHLANRFSYFISRVGIPDEREERT
jgi:hypothetical protein